MLLTTSPELMLTQSKLRRCTYCVSTESQGGSNNRVDCTLGMLLALLQEVLLTLLQELTDSQCML